MSLTRKEFKLFLSKSPKVMVGLSLLLNFSAILYFGYIGWWASVDFNGFTSMLFGIPVLIVLLVLAYLAGTYSVDELNAGRFSKYISTFSFVVLVLYFLSGFFPSLQKVSEIPIKVMTRLSKICTGKTPQQWVKPVDNGPI